MSLSYEPIAIALVAALRGQRPAFRSCEGRGVGRRQEVKAAPSRTRSGTARRG